MIHLKKKISLEPFISRHNFSNIKGFNTIYSNSSYGSIPYDIKAKNGEIITYSTMIDMYFWMKKYSKLLHKENCHACGDNINSICGQNNYNSAIDYYNIEVINKNNTIEQYYKSIDETYSIYSKYIGNLDEFESWVCVHITQIDENSDLLRNCITIPILMTENVHNIGEFTIYDPEWEGGIKYHKGDFIKYNDEIYKKKDVNENSYGSLFSEKYKESYFGNFNDLTYDDLEWAVKSKNDGKLIGELEQWENSNNNLSIIKTCSEFTIKDNKVVKNPSNNFNLYYGESNFMGNETEIFRNISKDNKNLGFFFIDNEMFKVFKSKYIIFENRFYTVRKVNESKFVTSYCFVNGIKYYSYFNGNIEYFIIGNESIIISNDEKTFITINGSDFETSDDMINIDSINYHKLDGYSIINNKIYLINKNKIVYQNKDNDEYKLDDSIIGELGKFSTNPSNYEYGYCIVGNKLITFEPYKIYNLNKKITGKTESSLSSLYNKNLSCDDIGNKLPCSYKKDANGNVVIPNNNDYLDFVCNVGNVSDVDLLYDDIYWGNIITNIKFYYLDNNGIESDNILNINEKQNNISDKIIEYIENNKDNNNIVKKLYCDITYYLGAIIDFRNNEYHYKINGIKYIDTVYITSELSKFYKTKSDMIYVKYFKLNYIKEETKFNEYSDKGVMLNKSKIEYEINVSNNEFRDENDGLINAPIFREEYKLGSSSLEKIDTNIYIDRGISNAFEKHLKLMEVNSMNELEKYGNGFYNIINLNK